MKYLALLLSFMIFSLNTLYAQSDIKWQEMENFHGYISSTFHPAEEGNFLHLRNKAAKMAAAAVAWQKSVIPSNYKPAETKAALIELVKQTTGIRDAIERKAADDELKTLISGLHDVFHKIVGECRVSDK